MEVFSDIEQRKTSIEASIYKYGHSAEHYYYCFLYNIESKETGYYFVWEDEKAILAKCDPNNEWHIFVGVLAPEQDRLRLLQEFLDYVYSHNAKKVWCEFKTPFYKETTAALKDSKYKANRINYSLTWPVFDMKSWSGEKMEGKEWKDIRYYWNRFFKEHKVEFRTYMPQDKDALLQIVKRWKGERNGTDKAYDHYYIKAIENDFAGYQTRVIIVDEKICGITAGYSLTNRDYYYSSIGITLKEHERIGEVANMDDLIELKKQRHSIVDFGGGEDKLTEFKNKFKPTSYYKTHIFSIVQRK